MDLRSMNQLTRCIHMEGAMNSKGDDVANLAAAELAVDYWKLLKVCERLVKATPEESRKRVGAQMRYSATRLESHLKNLGIELATFEGARFGPELPVIAINADDFANSENLLIESAVDPAVIMNDKVLQNARVMLRENDTNESGN